MKIGDRVRVVGPDDGGFEDLIGTEFEITETWKYGDVTRISTMGVPWYPESSLEMVEEPQDTPSPEVAIRIIGPAVAKHAGHLLCLAQELEELSDRIVDVEADVAEHDHDDITSRIQALEKWQAEHDLEKSSRFPADFLKAGDWCEVIRGGRAFRGEIVHIDSIDDGHVLAGGVWFTPKSLRKLSDEEIARRLNG